MPLRITLRPRADGVGLDAPAPDTVVDALPTRVCETVRGKVLAEDICVEWVPGGAGPGRAAVDAGGAREADRARGDEPGVVNEGVGAPAAGLDRVGLDACARNVLLWRVTSYLNGHEGGAHALERCTRCPVLHVLTFQRRASDMGYSRQRNSWNEFGVPIESFLADSNGESTESVASPAAERLAKIVNINIPDYSQKHMVGYYEGFVHQSRFPPVAYGSLEANSPPRRFRLVLGCNTFHHGAAAGRFRIDVQLVGFDAAGKVILVESVNGPTVRVLAKMKDSPPALAHAPLRAVPSGSVSPRSNPATNSPEPGEDARTAFIIVPSTSAVDTLRQARAPQPRRGHAPVGLAMPPMPTGAPPQHGLMPSLVLGYGPAGAPLADGMYPVDPRMGFMGPGGDAMAAQRAAAFGAGPTGLGWDNVGPRGPDPRTIMRYRASHPFGSPGLGEAGLPQGEHRALRHALFVARANLRSALANS